MTNESVAALLSVAWNFVHSRRALPAHVIADLEDAARCDSIAHSLRNQAQRLLRSVEAA